MKPSSEVLSLIERIFEIGPAEAMRQDELAAGRMVIRVGAVPWLSPKDWGEDDVFSTDGYEVRIIAIRARLPHSGAFSRLITAICRAGLKPVVVEPMFEMPSILERWGWRSTIVGQGMACEEQWRPPNAKWCKKRAQTSP